MTGELKSCPFCGEAPTPDYCSSLDGPAYSFHCQAADCPAWPNVQGETEAKAIAAWNTRATDPASITLPRDMVKEVRVALGQIHRLADRCNDLPDTDGFRRSYRDIDVSARIALAKLNAALDPTTITETDHG